MISYIVFFGITILSFKLIKKIWCDDPIKHDLDKDISECLNNIYWIEEDILENKNDMIELESSKELYESRLIILIKEKIKKICNKKDLLSDDDAITIYNIIIDNTTTNLENRVFDAIADYVDIDYIKKLAQFNDEDDSTEDDDISDEDSDNNHSDYSSDNYSDDVLETDSDSNADESDSDISTTDICFVPSDKE